ncbi:MAG: HAMP domain-containing histidine kinase [Hungatella sp.]|nr:HAMP domain-containing histidine kinase [Hungatella sp.]
MRKSKKIFWKTAAAGFGAMYMLIMGLATFLVKEQFIRDYGRQFREAAGALGREAGNKELDMEDEDWNQEERLDFYQSLADRSHWAVSTGDFELSVAFYDCDGRIMAKNREQAAGNTVRTGVGVTRKYMSFGLDDFLTKEEKEQLARYEWESLQSVDMDSPPRFRFSIQTSPDSRELWGLYVQELTWQEEEDWGGQWYEDPLTGGRFILEIGGVIDYSTGEEVGGGKVFYETGSQVVWQWINSSAEESGRKTAKIFETNLTFPYMGVYEKGSYERWKRWSQSPYLQGFPETGEFAWEPGIEEPPLMEARDGFIYQAGYRLQIGMAGDPFSYMEIRMESRPWQRAMDYMKYVYGAGLVLTFGCMAAVTAGFGRVYDRQAMLEERRRDFTNAMAHELKTPLGVIRNLAENLLEHNMEEKRDYYLTQIIAQTEEMDLLVVKMIQISRLDSEELTFKKEPVSFSELAGEQLARLEPAVREKEIRVEFEEKAEFVVQGDREYLGLAVWNLLSNAVDYNLPGGRVRIRSEKEFWAVENTGCPMTEEELVHAFELFYTGDKSRTREKKHMGMGLFLARKIFEIHSLVLSIENTSDGARAVIRQQANHPLYMW